MEVAVRDDCLDRKSRKLPSLKMHIVFSCMLLYSISVLILYAWAWFPFLPAMHEYGVLFVMRLILLGMDMKHHLESTF